MSETETYELRPVAALVPGDVVYLMARRRRISEPLQHPPEMRPEMYRVPMTHLDGTERIAPPFERDLLVPVRTNPPGPLAAGRLRSYEPNTAVQDNDLIGLDIDRLLARVRRLVGAGELVDPDQVRKLDSWMSRGFVPPAAWRRADYRKLRMHLSDVERRLADAQASARRAAEELRDRETADEAVS